MTPPIAPRVASKKRKKPTRKAVPIAAPKMKSRRKARQVTTAFHRLTHELEQLETQRGVPEQEKQRRCAEIRAELANVGGRAAYQDASILSTNFHKTSKWVFQLLTRFGRRPRSKEPPLRVLEVGAINTQLLSCPWLNVRAIDLQSRHDKIEQCDFFSLEPAQEFQVLVSSMVINCVPDATRRGDMLRMYYQHLQPGGLLFLMLPLLCLRNSQFMTYKRFVSILEAIGFRVKETKDSPKIAFFCLEKALEVVPSGKKFPEQRQHEGDKRNAFSVVL